MKRASPSWSKLYYDLHSKEMCRTVWCHRKVRFTSKIGDYVVPMWHTNSLRNVNISASRRGPRLDPKVEKQIDHVTWLSRSCFLTWSILYSTIHCSILLVSPESWVRNVMDAQFTIWLWQSVQAIVSRRRHIIRLLIRLHYRPIFSHILPEKIR